MSLFALLVLVHLLADYPLQGDFMAKAKNPSTPIPGVPWYTLMGSHAFIHAAFVHLLTGSAICGAVEAGAHFAIDYAKCRNLIGYNADQLLHIACKLGYVLFLGAFPHAD